MGAIREMTVRRARRCLLKFTQFTWVGYSPNWHHAVIADALDRMLDGDPEYSRLQINMPPQHGKSELASRRFPAYAFGRNPNLAVIATSYSATLAEKMNRDVQRIMDTPEYAELFPESRLNGKNIRTVSGTYLRNSETFEIVGHRGVYQCAGVEGGITGQGGQLLIIDDPFKNREEADSPVRREAVWDWYTSTLYTRQRKDVKILVIATRWHQDDLCGRLQKQAKEDPQADQWKVISFPAIAGHERGAFDPRQPGEALWPAFKSIQELRKIQATIGPYEWGALYQQDPRAPGGTEWPKEHFGPEIWFDEWEPIAVNGDDPYAVRVVACDPSKGRESKHGDYCAIVALGLTHDLRMDVQAWLGRWPSEEIVDYLVEIAGAFRAHAAVIEGNAFQYLLAAQVREEAIKRGVICPIEPIENTVAKPVRIRRLGPYLRSKQFRFFADKSTRLLVSQLEIFPTGDHDDGPDALEMAVRKAIELWNGRTQRRAKRGVRIR